MDTVGELPVIPVQPEKQGYRSRIQAENGCFALPRCSPHEFANSIQIGGTHDSDIANE